MKFFVPGEEDAEAAWERMRQACGDSVDTRPIYSMTYEDERTEVGVGEEGVIAIIPGQPFFIFQAASPRGSRSPRWCSSRTCEQKEHDDRPATYSPLGIARNDAGRVGRDVSLLGSS